jgi:type IX secretion system PorP/SprF family membrane protein
LTLTYYPTKWGGTPTPPHLFFPKTRFGALPKSLARKIELSRASLTFVGTSNPFPMQKLFTLTFLALVLCSSHKLAAQDPRFSQYYASPYNLNPAMTGVFNGEWRTTVNYRDQWNSILNNTPFRTYSVSGEYRRATASDDYMAFGIGAIHDEAGTARYQQNKIHLGFAFLKQLSGGRNKTEHYLSAGAQYGFGQHSIDWGRLWFSRQFDNGTEQPDFNAGSGENFGNGNTPLFSDFNAGLMWYAVLENGGFFYLGAAGHHLNEPKISLMQTNQFTLYRRWSGHFGGQLPLSDVLSLLPGIQVMKQGPAFETDFGMNVRYSNNDLDELALRAGAWLRLGNKLDKGIQADALTIVAMIERNRWMIGASYDLTVSSLANVNNSRGAFELSLTYFHPEKRRSKVTCPRF